MNTIIDTLPQKVAHDRRRKLTDADVREIRRLVAKGHKQVNVAQQFGVSRSWVSQLTRNTHDLFDHLDHLGADDHVLKRELPFALYRCLTLLLKVESEIRAYLSDLHNDEIETQARGTVQD